MKSHPRFEFLGIVVVSLLLQSCRPAEPPPEKTPESSENPRSVRDFQFRGGNPDQFVGALDEEFGSAVGKMVNISPAAKYLLLPPFRVRTADPIGAITALQRFSAGDGGKFGNWQVMTADGSPAPRLESAAAILVTPGDFPSREGVRDFHFGGGTPPQFVAALDKEFGLVIEKMVNISPAAASLSLPSFQARTDNPIGVITALQRFSAGNGGRFGNWQVMAADGSPASRLQSASAILVTPGDFTSGEATVDTTGKRDVEAEILDLRLQNVALKRALAELQQASKRPGRVGATPEPQPQPSDTAPPAGGAK